jgi:hypothetical protein
MQYLQEWVGGFSRELPKGVILDVRFMDRRLRRVVEDMSGASPEASLAGVGSPAIIANPSPGLDLYVNPVEVLYPDVTNASQRPAACNVPGALFADSANGNPVLDTFGNDLGGVCITNGATAGALGSDGVPDGFVNPVRIYRAMEIELSRNFSKGWQWRTNYRWSELSGNYEGAFRNDNGQSDPSISSLFDFTAGQYGLLGQQFAIGWLNTDRRHILNNFLSYTFANTFLKGLTLGTGVRIEGGTPITGFKAHPIYQNAGEIPDGRRGGFGRTATNGTADLHASYTLNLGEKQRLTFGADMFNITNQRTLLRVDQNEDRSFGVPNVDFLKPVGRGGTVGAGGVAAGGAAYQRPFYARLMVRWQF